MSKKTYTGGGTHGDGVLIGASATEKVGLHGADPVAQAAAITDVADDLATDANGTTIAGAVNANAGAINDILAALRAKGIIATAE